MLSTRQRNLRHNDIYSSCCKINVREYPKETECTTYIIIVYNIYTAYLPKSSLTTLATYADEIIELASNKDFLSTK